VGWREFSNADKGLNAPTAFGETEYVGQYVFKMGQKFLGPYVEVLSRTNSQTSRSEATSAAIALITATAETAKSVPPPNGIGGPIDVAAITKAGVEIKRY
jgi:hypothetical protein